MAVGGKQQRSRPLTNTTGGALFRDGVEALLQESPPRPNHA